MDWSGSGGAHLTPLLIGLAVVALIVRRNLRPRPLRIERLWVRPALFALITGTTISASAIPLDLLSIAIFAVALLLGAGLGWQRGKAMRISVHPETHEITTQPSVIGIVLILGVLVLKVALRLSSKQDATVFGLPGATVTDAPVLLLGAMIITQNLEMWTRASRLLAEAQAGAGGPRPAG